MPGSEVGLMLDDLIILREPRPRALLTRVRGTVRGRMRARVRVGVSLKR